MTWPEALGYLKAGKCKGVTRLDLPTHYFITLFKHTLTWYRWTHGLNNGMNEPKWGPDDIILYVGDALDSPGSWINLGMWNDDNWLICERVWDKEDL